MNPRLLLAALLAGSALAAATEAPVVLAPWLVEAAPLRADATAPRASALLARDAWSGRAIGTLADALGRVPGVIMLESFGGFEPPRLSLRGSGLQSAPSSRGVALLFDGLPLGLADGSFNAALFDPQLGASIAVHRGLDAWRAAPAALGGAFDLMSARETKTAATLRAEVGPFGAWRTRASGFVAPADTSAQAALSFARQDGWRAQSEQERIAFDAGLRRAFTNGVEATVNLYHARPKYDVPGPLTLTAALAAPRSVSSDAQRDRPARESELWRVASTIASRGADREFEAGLSLARTDDHFQQLQANGTSLSRSDDAALRASFAQRFTLGLPQLARVTGNATRGWRDLRRFRNDRAELGPLFGRDGLYATTASLALEDHFALTRSLMATLAIARIGARRDIVDRLAPTRTTQALGSASTVPQASVRWTPRAGLAFFGGGSRAVEPPTFDDLLVVSCAYPNLARRSQPLRTQRATTWELGARGARVGRDLLSRGMARRNSAARRCEGRSARRRQREPDASRGHRSLRALAAARWSGACDAQHKRGVDAFYFRGRSGVRAQPSRGRAAVSRVGGNSVRIAARIFRRARRRQHGRPHAGRSRRSDDLRGAHTGARATRGRCLSTREIFSTGAISRAPRACSISCAIRRRRRSSCRARAAA